MEHVFDIKSLLFFTSSLLLIFFFLFNFSVKEVLFLVMLAVFSFEKGLRGWSLPIVSPGTEWWIHGYSLYFGLSLRTVLIFSLFLICLPDLFKLFEKKFKDSIHYVFLFLGIFIFFAFLSTLFSSDYFLSFFGFLKMIQAVCLFLISILFFYRQKFREYLLIAFLLIIFLNGYIGVQQFINGGPLGLYLEDGIGYNNTGYFTTDGSILLYRVSGLIGHPTFFASYLSMLLAIGFGIFLSFLTKKSKVTVIFSLLSILFGLFALYASYVRSSWFTILFISLLLLVFMIYNNTNIVKKITKKQYLIFGSILFSICILGGEPLYSRIISTGNFLSDGSGVVRISLINEAGKMISSFPYFGAGLNLSTRLMSLQTLLPPELLGFMFPVHNTFILFFAEIGIIGALSFIGFIFTVLATSFKYVKHEVLYFGIWLSVVAFILNAQVHTLFNQDPSFDLLFLSLGFLVSICFEKNKSH